MILLYGAGRAALGFLVTLRSTEQKQLELQTIIF
jgi:hypothetical protein